MQNWYGYDYATAAAEARKIVAYPGTSEHQLGLACDIVDGYSEYMHEALADTELLKWMGEHCAEYGFILRYPKDKTDITGVSYEPWHFRYVGAEAASYIMEKSLTLEEFTALYA
jgi:D-alanyl-D-alanine carboxypeptidase